MFQNLNDIYEEASDAISKIQIPRPQRVLPSQSTVAIKSIGQVNFQRKSIEDFLRQLPGHNKLVKETHNDVPQSVKLLNYYCQKAGFKAMGEVTDKFGNKFIGRKDQVTPQGNKYVRQFPTLKGGDIFSPDLFENFTTHANNAIHKWNQFAEAEAKLGGYINDISTQQGRKKLIKKNIKLSTLGSRYFQVLSSLAVLYLDPRSTNRNFLEFPYNQTVQDFKQILRGNGLIQDVMTAVMTYINEFAPLQRRKFINSFIVSRQQVLRLKMGQEYEQIEDQINSLQTYIPSQMVSNPTKQKPQWIKYFKNQNQNTDGVILIQQWDYESNTIKFFNFF